MKDYFGYDRNIKSKELISADFAKLDIGNGRVSLVQNVNASYGHRSEFRFETGSSDAYFVSGQPMGQISVSRLVGRKGFLSEHRENPGLACGELDKLSIYIDGDENCSVEDGGNDKLKFEGAHIENFNISFGAGALEVSESFGYKVASMNII